MITFSGPGATVAEKLRDLADSLEEGPGYGDITMIAQSHWEDVFGGPHAPRDQKLVGITVLITSRPDAAKDAIDALKT